MSDTKRPKTLLRSDELDDFSHWRLPDMSSNPEDEPLNLLGRRAGVQYQAPEEEEIRPPTLAEIEAIRAEAEQEGYHAGHAEGLAEGMTQGRLDGLKQGHEEGFAQGFEQGMAQGLASAAELIARFEALLGQFAAPLSLLDNEIEQELLQLSMSLGRQIVRHELKTHPQHLLAALQEGIDCLPIKEQEVKLRLNPDDIILMQSLYSSAQLDEQRWRLIADPLLERGECIIDSQRSRVDLRLEDRIAAVLAAPMERLDTLRREARQKAAALPTATDNLETGEDASAQAGEADDAQTPAPSAE
ncbi:flagellar assembly protein FliH [Shewanella sp. JM162201]|uniref:Flagellar assembly protein FliH n=1 Tax=Shewanella jiangmenensis TaxID=2837387 RepID=A0ABS5UY74_9GAMM|nr:flagellar assembly protein FliH [Shewanella jiangmenensis]MBT1443046.1 flagellar assembly protein FliH [Shewanella jiangmenensis]